MPHPHPNPATTKGNAATDGGDNSVGGGGGGAGVAGGAAPFHTRSTTRGGNSNNNNNNNSNSNSNNGNGNPADDNNHPPQPPPTRTFYQPSVHQFTCRGAFHIRHDNDRKKQNTKLASQSHSNNNNTNNTNNNTEEELEALIKDTFLCNGIQTKLRRVANYPLAQNKEMAIHMFESSAPPTAGRFKEASGSGAASGAVGIVENENVKLSEVDADADADADAGEAKDDGAVEAVDLEPESSFSSYGTTQVNILTLQEVAVTVPQVDPFGGFGALPPSGMMNPFGALFGGSLFGGGGNPGTNKSGGFVASSVSSSSSTSMTRDGEGKRVATTRTKTTKVDKDGKPIVQHVVTQQHLDDGGRVEVTVTADGCPHTVRCTGNNDKLKKANKQVPDRTSIGMNKDEGGKWMATTISETTTVDEDGKRIVQHVFTQRHLDDGGRVETCKVAQVDGRRELVSISDGFVGISKTDMDNNQTPSNRPMLPPSSPFHPPGMAPAGAVQSATAKPTGPAEVAAIATDCLLGVSVSDSVTSDPSSAVPQSSSKPNHKNKRKDGNQVGWRKSEYLFRLGRFIPPFMIVSKYYQDKEAEERRRKDMQKEYNDMRDRLKKGRWDKAGEKDAKNDNETSTATTLGGNKESTTTATPTPISDSLSHASSRTEYYLQQIQVQMDKNLAMMGIMLRSTTEPDFPKKVWASGLKVYDNLGPTAERTQKLMGDCWGLWTGWAAGIGGGSRK